MAVITLHVTVDDFRQLWFFLNTRRTWTVVNFQTKGLVYFNKTWKSTLVANLQCEESGVAVRVVTVELFTLCTFTFCPVDRLIIELLVTMCSTMC
jgi:hypothetical protein